MLDEKQREIFKRNLDIFCLDKYESLPEEKQYYKEQLEVKVEKEDWHNLFFMKSLYNKLNDIAS